MRAWAIAVAIVASAGFALAQSGTSTVTTATADVVPASYVIGPNDVVAMTVFGDPELTDPEMRVDQDGTIHTPYGKTPVHVGGLTMAGAAEAIAQELVRDQLAVNPKVDVRVVDPESHPIVIAGLGVRQPTTIQAIQPIRLVDALVRAGGLNENTGAEITVERTKPDGTHEQFHVSASQLMAKTDNANNPWLYGGEQVTVMPGGNVYLSGAVATPGAYPLSDTDPLTVRKLLAKAKGLAPAAKAGETQLIQNLGKPNQTVTVINLAKILDGASSDIPLKADDMVYVPVSGIKKVSLEAISRTLTILTVAAGQILVR